MTDEPGLFNKYRIRSTVTGNAVEGAFVLRPARDATALAALIHYAALTPNLTLAADLEDWIDKIQRGEHG